MTLIQPPQVSTRLERNRSRLLERSFPEPRLSIHGSSVRFVVCTRTFACVDFWVRPLPADGHTQFDNDVDKC